MPVLLQVALGGALGAMLRYGVTAAGGRIASPAFPWATMGVNVLGSFAMGVAVVLLLWRDNVGPAHAAPFVLPGLLGGFTTFSAFSLDTFLLIERGRPVPALLYAAGSVLCGLAALVAGIWLARRWSFP